MRASTSKIRACGFVVGIVAAFTVVTGGGPAFAPAALAEDMDELAVGTQLEALATVKLSRAELAKGSRVSVAQLVRRQGRLSAVDVELADGHVTRVALATVRSSFRVVAAGD